MAPSTKLLSLSWCLAAFAATSATAGSVSRGAASAAWRHLRADVAAEALDSPAEDGDEEVKALKKQMEVATAEMAEARAKAKKERQCGMNSCIETAKKFITKPVTKASAIEKATDFCAIDKKIDDRNFVCPHMKEMIKGAFAEHSSKEEFDAEAFCKITEEHKWELKNAGNIPNIGILDDCGRFALSEHCNATVAAALSPCKTLKGGELPDFWYSMCMNQDCAHYLPSRTRWCTVSHAPFHSSSVCTAVKVFAKDETSILDFNELEPGEVCGVYKEFVEEAFMDVDAYEHVINGIEEHDVESPENPARALGSSQLVNDAAAHHIRDNAGEPPEPNAAASGSFLAASTSRFLGLLGMHA